MNTLSLNLVDALSKPVLEVLALPFTNAQISFWYGMSSTEVAALRRKHKIPYDTPYKGALTEQHRLLGLELDYYAVTDRKTETEMANLLGWSLRKYRAAILGTAQLELTDLIKLNKLGINIQL